MSKILSGELDDFDDSFHASRGREDFNGLDDIKGSVHPDLLPTVRSPFLKEAKRLLLQFILGKKSTSSAVSIADHMTRSLHSRAVSVAGENGDGKKRGSLKEVAASMDEADRRRMLMMESEEETPESLQAELERNFVRNLSADVAQSVEIFPDLVTKDLARQMGEGYFREGVAVSAVTEHLENCIELGFDPTNEDATASVKEELRAQLPGLTDAHMKQFQRDAKQFVDTQVPRRVKEALAITLSGVNEEVRSFGIQLAIKKARMRSYAWIQKYINKSKFDYYYWIITSFLLVFYHSSVI